MTQLLQDDINFGLEHFYDQFHFTHLRLISAGKLILTRTVCILGFNAISTGINNYRALIREVAQILRPGGLIVVTELEYAVYDQHQDLVQPFTDRTIWYPQWMHALVQTHRRVSCDIDAGNLLSDWFREDAGYDWEDIGGEVFWVPLGRWFQDPGRSRAFLCIRRSFLDNVFAFNPANEREMWVNEIGEMVKADSIVRHDLGCSTL